jgi:16S rRNA (cytosine1402-N4)-methyltransferase
LSISPLFGRRPNREEFPHRKGTPSWQSGHLPEVAARPPSIWELDRKPTVPSEAEIAANRARAASLRAV